MCSLRVTSNSLRVHSGEVREAPGGRRHRQAVCQTLTGAADGGVNVGLLSFGSLIKVDAASCRLFPLVGGGQSIDAGCLCWDSVMGGPCGYVSGLVFAPTPSPLVKFSRIAPPWILSLQQFGSH